MDINKYLNIKEDSIEHANRMKEIHLEKQFLPLYTPLEVVGLGSFGICYKALDKSNDKLCVIKVKIIKILLDSTCLRFRKLSLEERNIDYHRP